MCGRFVRTSPQAVIMDEFGVEHFVNVDFTPRYNIAPSQPLSVALMELMAISDLHHLTCWQG